MSDTTNFNAGSFGIVHIAKQLTEARIEDRDRELITRVVTDLLASGEERSRLLGEINQLCGELAELRSRVSQLENEKAKVTSERDVYLRAVYGLLPKPESPFTEEELSELIHHGIPLEETIRELEAMKDSGNG